MPALFPWLKAFCVPSLISVAVTFLGLRFLLRGELKDRITEQAKRQFLSEGGRLALSGLIIAAVVLLVASAMGWQLGAPTFASAMLVLVLVSIRNFKTLPAVLSEVSWSVIPLVAGLFVIVQALQQAGLRTLVANSLRFVENQNAFASHLFTALALGLGSNVINNLPVGLITGSVLQSTNPPTGVTNAALIGVDLGSNLSVAGSLATILWLMALRRDGMSISGWEFFKIGVVVMPPALIGSVLALAK
jgi:arsenical pump membrane protein